MSAKKIHNNSIIGEEAITLIRKIVYGMGFAFNQSGGVEAGIDGTIEIRDAVTGEVTNCLIGFQSKGTSIDFTAETPTSFTYLCDERDLAYWLGGNVPVILIVSRPKTEEAYWVPLRDYFNNPILRQGRKILFDKTRNRFDVGSKSALIDLAVPKDTGLYFSPTPKTEIVYSNLLPLTAFAPSVYTAHTEAKDVREAWGILNRFSPSVGGEWILTEGQIRSFHDLREYPWNQLCDVGTVEEDDAAEWAASEDEDVRRDFVKLLNLSLTQMLKGDMVWYRDKHYHFFRETDDLTDRKISYRGLQKATERDIFKVYRNKKDKEKIAYCRHTAFRHYFQRLEGQWYLEINPTYHYTRDGRNLSFFYEEKLQGIKRLERNNAVFGQVYFLAQYLTPPPDLFSHKYPFLTFGPLQYFELPVGIDDKAWLPKEDEEEAKALDADEADEGTLFATSAGRTETLRMQF